MPSNQFLSIACANYVAGVISYFAGGGGEGGDGDEGATLETYSDTYSFILWFSVIAGAVVLLMSRKIDKLMHGIK